MISLGSFAQSNSCSDVTQRVTASRWHNTTITSPHYPANYSNNSTCTWLIEVASDTQSVGFILKVTFNSFQLEEAKTAFLICNDKLEFYDGNSTNLSDLLGSYCGAVSPKVVYSTGRLLYVKFQSDGRYSDKGFSLNISAVMEGKSITTHFVNEVSLSLMLIQSEQKKRSNRKKGEKKEGEGKDKRRERKGKLERQEMIQTYV